LSLQGYNGARQLHIPAKRYISFVAGGKLAGYPHVKYPLTRIDDIFFDFILPVLFFSERQTNHIFKYSFLKLEKLNNYEQDQASPLGFTAVVRISSVRAG
jgi:hypothetical protein